MERDLPSATQAAKPSKVFGATGQVSALLEEISHAVDDHENRISFVLRQPDPEKAETANEAGGECDLIARLNECQIRARAGLDKLRALTERVVT